MIALLRSPTSLLVERTSVEWMAAGLRPHTALERALRREQMTVDQFVGLSLAVGIALAHGAVADDDGLDRIIERGAKELQTLRDDERLFSELSRDSRHIVRTKAVWITRLDRASRLGRVPPENAALVEKYRERLEPMFPPEFLSNPLVAVADRLEERGVPFEELPETGSDAHIPWDAAKLIR